MTTSQSSPFPDLAAYYRETCVNWKLPTPKPTSEKLNQQVVGELYRTMELLGAEPRLLSIIGSWRDTQDEDVILDLLRDWNRDSSAAR